MMRNKQEQLRGGNESALRKETQNQNETNPVSGKQIPDFVQLVNRVSGH
jgi:hypothetical protein